MDHEMDTITILRDRCKEYRDLLTAAASIFIVECETEWPEEIETARENFLIKCREHGIVEDSDGEQRDRIRD